MEGLDEAAITGMFRRDLGCDGTAPDDIERVAIPNGAALAAKVDTLVGSTDVPPRMSPAEAARKSVAACVSDFAAKGIRPEWALVSVTIPETHTRADVEMLSAGLAEAAAEFGCAVLGGDTNRGKDLSITVCMLGRAGPSPRRGGAAPGDSIFVSGPFGLAAAGLRMMMDGSAHTATLDGAAQAVLRPTPRLEFGVRAAPMFSSSMDSSDGLSTTLNEMARRSGASMVVTGSPAAGGLEEFARQAGLDAASLTYDGGEEYEIVFTAHPSEIPRIEEAARETGAPLIRIGHVEAGSGAFIQDGDGGVRKPLADGGWKCF